MVPDEHGAQHRGNRGAYERYLAGMDSSMRQKVALTAAHLLCRGKVADMGMGSGAGSHALAALYPEMDVVGVDLDPTMVDLAREKYGLANLAFVVGDIAAPVFGDAALQGIFDSSVLHHVTSFGGYEHERAARALEVQARELAAHGVLVVRDFVDPGAGDVLLDLPEGDGEDTDDPRRASSAALFERFAREFRVLSERPGFAFERLAPPRAGWRRYRVAHKLAVEFVLRKDYRTDWEAEVKEEYTYFTQARFESTFASLGLRVLASTPLRTPWIVKNRFEGKFDLHDVDGRPVEWPATNYVVVGEKVGAGEGVRFREAGDGPAPSFLEMSHYRNKATGEVRDLVRRPNVTVDVVPHFEAFGDVFVLARMSYPRPIVNVASRRSASLDEARPAEYVTEPLNVQLTDKPVGQTVEEALLAIAGIGPSRIRGFRPGSSYYPSPGGLQEEVRSVLVDVEPVFVEERIAPSSGWSTSGRVRAIEAQQVLRAAQVGGLPDARLELNVYDLLLQLGREVGPWIGEAMKLSEAADAPSPASVASLGERPARRAFERVSTRESSGFLELSSIVFEELDRAGSVLHRASLEVVAPRSRATNTVATALVLRRGDDVLLGVDDDDLPAAQCFHGNSQLAVAPAWRLPPSVSSTTPARAWVRERLLREYDVVAGDIWELGGRYHPSPGATPEVVYPLAVEVKREGPGGRALAWIKLADAVAGRGALLDGHLKIVALRAAHALGLLGR